MYSHVHFRDDGMKVVVPKQRIKKFSPTNLRDFDRAKWYIVQWDGDEKSGYFRAQIMKLFGKYALLFNISWCNFKDNR